MEEKFCPDCEKNKPLTAFIKRCDSRDGHTARCADCTNASRRKNYAAKNNPVAVEEKNVKTGSALSRYREARRQHV